MNEANILDTPAVYPKLLAKCTEIGFTMPSDVYIGTLLKTLISSKPRAHVLELGTGIGLSLAWMVEGLDNSSKLISIDNDPRLIEIAKGFFTEDHRVSLIAQDGSKWLQKYEGEPFDLIFADAWPGKYSDLNEAISLLKPGGFYVIDDMNPQPNWPEGHGEKAAALVTELECRKDLILTKMNWSTGVIVATKVVDS